MDNKRRRLLSLSATTVDGAPAAAGPPPGKRLRAAGCSPADPPQSPRWRLLSQSVLVVLFLRRSCRKDTAAAEEEADGGVSRIGRVVREELCRCVGPILRGYSLLFSKLEGIEQRIENLTHKVDQMTPSRPSHCNHQQPMHEVNNEGTNAEELATKEDEAKSTPVRLRFLNEMKLPVYHDDEIKAGNDESIRIGIFNGEQMIKSGALSKVKLEILALEGNFPYCSTDSWTSKEFNEHRACGRDGIGNVLTVKHTIQLINGEASLGAIKFREGSCRARSGMFILAARVCDDARTSVQVQEAVMMPVVVQDRRNKSNGKSHPPKLDDKVHRLEEIAINGIFCKRLAEKGIETVEGFLKALNKDPDNLAKILQIKKGSKAWEKMITHSRECSLEGEHELKSYRGAQRNVVLFFNCVNLLVGARFDDCYIASDKLSSSQQVRVEKLKREAYQLLDGLPFDHIMEDGLPISIPENTNAGGHHAAYQVQGIEAVEGLDHAQIESSFANANYEHYYQDQSTVQVGQELFSSSVVADWPQGSFAQPSSSHQTNHVFYSGAEVNYGYQTNCGAPCDYRFQEAFMASGFDQMELQGQRLEASTSTHTNPPFPPQQQLAFSGAPGSSNQVNMQSQGQAAAILPGNWPSEPSTSIQGNLPLQQQWLPQNQYQGNNF